MKLKTLYGHTSPETAFIVKDYPYGFRLRCEIRYWVEYSKNKGFRVVSQTSNPKRGGAWNAPKKGTYSFLAILTQNVDTESPEFGYISSIQLSAYAATDGIARFREHDLSGIVCGTTTAKELVDGLEAANARYEAKMKNVQWVIAPTAPAQITGNMEDNEEQQRRDEKNGLYGDREDIAN